MWILEITCVPTASKPNANMQCEDIIINIKTLKCDWIWHDSVCVFYFYFPSICFNLSSKRFIYLIIDLLFACKFIIHPISVYSIWLHVCLIFVTGAKILRILFPKLSIYDWQSRKSTIIWLACVVVVTHIWLFWNDRN